MQTITAYLRTDSVAAKPVDAFNQIVKDVPTITRGLRAMLILKLLDAEGVPVDGLGGFVSWDFVMATDWIMTTPPQIRVNSGITVNENEIRIPLTETNTEELIAALGNKDSMDIGAELAGFENGESVPGFLIQFDMKVRNRRSDAGSGSPTPVADGNYSAAQIDAILARYQSPVAKSSDLSDWSDSEPANEQVPTFDAETGRYVPKTPRSPTIPDTTSDLNDWSDTEPSNGQVPVFSSQSGKYIPTTLDLSSGGNGGITPDAGSASTGTIKKLKVCAGSAVAVEKDFTVYSMVPSEDCELAIQTGEIDLAASRVEFDLEVNPSSDVAFTFPENMEKRNEFPDRLTADCGYLFHLRSLRFGWLGEFIHLQQPFPPITITQAGSSVVMLVVNGEPMTVDFGDGTRSEYQAIEGADGDIEDLGDSTQIQHPYSDAEERTVRIVKGAESVYALVFMASGLSAYDVSQHRNLSVLGIMGEDSTITRIDLSPLPRLRGFLFQGLQVETLDFSANPLLQAFMADNALISELDFSHNPLMANVEISSCHFTSESLAALLSQLAAGTVENGTFNFSQTPHLSLTAEAQAAMQTLTLRNWDVTTDAVAAM